MSPKWSEDTPEALAASLAREHDDDPVIGAFLDAFIHGDGPGPQRRRQVPKKVGAKAKHVAIPRTRGSGMTYREAAQVGDYIGEKNRLRRALRRAADQHGEQSPQARKAAHKLRTFIEQRG